jgi:spore maturation protein CgeB
MKLNIVIIGLSVTSSWGNGHATTYRALIEALVNRGHQVTFLERDVPWYRSHRDLTRPSNWTIKLYRSLQDIPKQHTTLIRNANLVILGSYVPDGVAIAEWMTTHAQGVTAFYDIDTPVTLAGLDRGLEYLSPAMIPRFDLYLSFSGGPVPGMIEDAYGSPMARVLYCSADSQVYRPHPVHKQLLLAPANMLTDQQFVVAGSKYPDHLVWPENVSRIEHLSQQEHPSFYSQQRFTLNLTRADMRALGFSPSVRLFEAAACGTPVISDRWPGIETIFEPGSEILLVSDAREVSQILRDIPEERRLTIAAKARQRVLADHTPDHRARQLEAYYLEAAGRRRRKLPQPAATLTTEVAEM